MVSAFVIIQLKKYKNALVKIEASRHWPENLGVGMPYDVDDRMQDYLTAYCLNKLGSSSEVSKWNDKVVEYTNQHFVAPSVNNILAFNIYEHRSEKEKANALLEKLKSSPTASRPTQRWVVAAAEKDQSTLNALESELNRNKYVNIMEKILKLP